MHIATNSGDFALSSKQELEQLIRKIASNSCDEIWINGAEEYPALTILVSGDNACVHYFLNDTGDLWQSVGECADDTVFQIGNGNPDFAPEGATIPLEKAMECMRIFFDSLQKPNCILWREL